MRLLHYHVRRSRTPLAVPPSLDPALSLPQRDGSSPLLRDFVWPEVIVSHAELCSSPTCHEGAGVVRGPPMTGYLPFSRRSQDFLVGPFVGKVTPSAATMILHG